MIFPTKTFVQYSPIYVHMNWLFAAFWLQKQKLRYYNTWHRIIDWSHQTYDSIFQFEIKEITIITTADDIDLIEYKSGTL